MYISTIFFGAVLYLASSSEAKQINRTQISQSIMSKTATAVTASQTAAILNATVLDCFLTLPASPLTAQGLSTPFLLKAPCSQSVATQQAFAEAAIFDPTTGTISIYHPLVIDAGTNPAAAPVVPTLPTGAVVGLWFGFNGGTLQLLDTNGENANTSPTLKTANCINGLPGTQGDVFGQVSWCNAEQWFTAANTGVSSGKTVIPDLGVDKLGNACPTSRSFEITDACPSDNVPTQYLLLANGQLAQDTAANRAANPDATVINNASDEALLTNIIDPLIGCTPFVAPSLDDPGSSVPALALSELQASAKQAAPIGLVPLNDPDCLLTAGGTVSTTKTNTYRLGVNQPVISSTANGELVPYCQDMVSVAPPFLSGFQTVFSNAASPDLCVGTNLFTFLANRYLMSLTQLTCPASSIPFQPVVCKLNGNGVATACTITLTNGTTTGSTSTKATSSVSATSKAVTSVKASSSVKAVSVATSIKASASTSVKGSISTSAKAITKDSSTLATSFKLGTTSLANNVATSSITTPPSSTTALSTVAALSSKTQQTKTILVEIITFFIFLPALGSPPPGVTSNSTGFLVEEALFLSLPAAASAACTSQFNACAALAGSAFSGTDCLDQLNSCQGVATTASQTASAPATVTASVQIPVSGTGTVSLAGVTSALGTGGDACAPVTVTIGQGSVGTNVPRAVHGHGKFGLFRH
ncbi:uncharacterized protein LY89DRAFT_735553 [Mollisia scopiformis]|uniref:Uncharacterized protein n=1 Tax=Mollisia scopiformis TaxID=149040 RepID=A0A194X5T6_MOLSC|nr:uncharacterized protein LY89DRAFT_735553 [Mollisia scopiformis]KUJ15439.1 hypothetical protein LY89DRAFT_735553 [Mollisia scopiformis]